MIKDIIEKILKRILTKEVKQTKQAKGETEIKAVKLSEIMGEDSEPDLRVIGLFSNIEDEKVADITQALLYLNEKNKKRGEKEESKPIDFYLNTYGGSADDMFALYDVMRIVQKDTEIHTIGVGKVMSAGTLLLAAGTKGKRKIGRNCRVMIHNVAAGNFGNLPNLANELEAVQRLQEDYISAMVENTKFTRKKLEKLLNEKVNIYLDADEAVKYGLADEII